MLPDNKSTTRRNFIRTSAALAATGIALGGSAEGAFAGSRNNAGKLTEKAKRLMDQFQLKYPIFQAAPGGEELAVAMSATGCMAAMQLTWNSPDECAMIVSRLAKANVNFYGNFVLHFPLTNLDKALESGLKIVQFSWGIPDEKIVKKVRSFNAKLGVQIANKEGARAALAHNPDFLICQGNEAGGHVQSSDALQYSLQEVVSIAGQIPVLAAGGIATGKDIAKMLNAGASGVVMGTRLIATAESTIHQTYKESIVEAKENSTVFTNCFELGWNAMHRVLKNKTYETWEAAGCPQTGKKPGENEVLGASKNGDPILRYSSNHPDKGTTGKIKEMIMYAGVGSKDVNDLPSVKELIPRLWKEFES